MERGQSPLLIPPPGETQPLLTTMDSNTPKDEENKEEGIGLRDLSQIPSDAMKDQAGGETAFTTSPGVLIPVSGSIQTDVIGGGDEDKVLGDYQPLTDDLDTPKLYSFLASLGITPQQLDEAQIPRAILLRLYQKEFSATSWWKWSSVDHAIEKYCQWPLLSPADIGDSTQKAYHRLKPEERSILLKTSGGLMKAYAVRGFVQGLETGLIESVHYFIYAMLAYRFGELLHTGQSDFDEFQAIFSGSNQKGIDSLVRSLAHLDAKWLRLILAAPVILGVLQGLWRMRSAQLVSSEERQVTFDKTTQLLSQAPSICGDVIYEEMPIISNCVALSSSVQKLEQWVRWDGRLDSASRKQAFDIIRQAARDSRKISQLNILESLAKIAHGIGLKDFHRLQRAGYTPAELTGFLYIKTMALVELERLSQPVLKTEEAKDRSSLKKLSASLAPVPRRLYVSYLLWWLGQSTSFWKQQLPFTLFKIIKLGLEGLFLQKIIASILEAIRCPDKPGFQFGDGYQDWASDYTAACFTTRVSFFRTLNTSESVDAFVAEIPQYHLTELTTLDLYNKYLTSEEASQIIQAVVQQGAPLTRLDLLSNQISAFSEGMLSGLNQLTSLDLSINHISTLNKGVFSALSQLTILYLYDNQISVLDEGVFNGLSQLTTLDLAINSISVLSEGMFSELSQLTSLNLSDNQISVLNEGVFSGLNQLTTLELWANQISALNNGVFSELNQLTTLDLYDNHISVLREGVFSELSQLTTLDLWFNQISVLAEGVFNGLSQLTTLDLFGNQISVLSEVVFSGLNQLQMLYLSTNYLNTSTILSILPSLPVTLTELDISSNQISTLPRNFSTLLPVGLKSLSVGDNSFIPRVLTQEFMQYFPLRLTTLALESSHIVNITEGSFSDFSVLTTLDLSFNQIHILNKGVFSGLNQLTTLYLDYNKISVLSEGVFNGLNQLTELDLYENRIIALSESVFNGLNRLTYLDLRVNDISVLREGAFSGLNQLTYLDLSNNRISLLHESVFSGLSQLTFLYLYDNQISVLDEGVFNGLSQLTTLFLAGNSISVLSEGVFSELNQLTELDLDSNNISVLSEGMFSELGQLTELDLRDNRLNNTAVQNLTQHFPYQLNSLDVRYNQIGNEGALALAEILPCTNLTTISFTGNPANDTTLAIAAQQNALQKVCDDQLCHANLLATESCGITTDSTATTRMTWGTGSSIEVMDDMESDSPDSDYWLHSVETPSFQDALSLPSAARAEPATPLLAPAETGAMILGVVSMGILLYKNSTWIHAVVNASNRLFQRCWNGESREETRTITLARSSDRRYDLFTSLPSPTPQAPTPTKTAYFTPR